MLAKRRHESCLGEMADASMDGVYIWMKAPLSLFRFEKHALLSLLVAGF